ncbi:MAG: biotin--[acetyl-CoA-carboxylase] ligase [candidate division WS1 bacterium]|nr:biotin--[acetyl-CoA-carboxylase] ligase [candidate division WS1 bacterium]
MRFDLAEAQGMLSDCGICWSLSYIAEAGSTNAELARAARSGAAEGTVIVCGHQTAGRGRQGRMWEDRGHQDLIFSLLLRPRCSPSDYGLLPLLASVALVEAVQALTGVMPSVKWPNDVMVQGAKLAGILLEADTTDGWAVIGMGVNLLGPADSLPISLRGSAMTVEAATGQVVTREQMVVALLDAVAMHYVQAQRSGYTEVLNSYRRADVTVGRRLRLLRGDETLEGIAEQIDERGRLVIVGEMGRIATDAGEVHLLK